MVLLADEGCADRLCLTLETPWAMTAPTEHAIRLSASGRSIASFRAARRTRRRARPVAAAAEEPFPLRGVLGAARLDFELEKGARLGIIGRNGAGKTTLLKLITGAVASTEGTIETSGTVQALLEASAGLHPEFTGKENIRAALTYQGFNQREIRAAEEDITEFTELGSFLDQPFRTYSTACRPASASRSRRRRAGDPHRRRGARRRRRVLPDEVDRPHDRADRGRRVGADGVALARSHRPLLLGGDLARARRGRRPRACARGRQGVLAVHPRARGAEAQGVEPQGALERRRP